MFDKLLIANRGEIACRIIRTARALGCRCVAVFSDADADALHVRLADEAVRIGPAPAAQSYLHIGALIEAARASGADAVHPGYGFLSENADFAQACVDAGLVFVGPPPAAIRAMGDKAFAKRRMRDAGVPCVPGYLGDEQDDARLAAEAKRLGFPLLVKAVAGGGGRGLRRVDAADALAASLDAARREALAAFGDGTLMLEALVEPARHIEVQVFADAHGRTIHLGTRDCSVQRRRQKLVEEAPAPGLDDAQRDALGRDAVAAARAVGYAGAGTVEFVVDASGRHWFLEMNTRLQVEHPVTECVAGVDLVEWQLRVAAGEPLPLEQHDVRCDGHAIEARLYAEDPYDGFAPQSGRIVHWRPDRGPGVRIDAGVADGDVVTPYYDGLLAKFVAHGRDRDDARRRLARAIERSPLVGPTTNGKLLRDIVRHPAFAAAAVTTTTIDGWAERGEPPLVRPAPDDDDWLVAAAVRSGAGRGWRPAWASSFPLVLEHRGERRTLRPLERLTVLERAGHELRYAIDGVVKRRVVVDDAAAVHVARDDGALLRFEEPAPWAAGGGANAAHGRAPVAGVVAQVLVAPGDRVDAGQPLASIEAMKMQMWLTAPRAGTVAAVHARPKDSVAAGALLVELKE